VCRRQQPRLLLMGQEDGQPPCPVWLQQKVDELAATKPTGWMPSGRGTGAGYGLPQTYGITTFGTDEGMARAHNEWDSYGYSRLVGLYGTYSKTDAQMRQILRVAANRKPVATAGWKWVTTSDAEWDHIASILPE